MLPVWRIAPRISQRVAVFYSGSRPLHSTAEPSGPVLEQSDFLDSLKHYEGIKSVEGIQGDLAPSMSVSAARRVLDYAAKYQTEGPSVQGMQGTPSSEGRRTLLNKYFSEANLGKQQARHFSNSALYFSSQQGAQVNVFKDSGLEDDPCPQGIQGDECVQFKLWLENCQRYHLPNCDEQVNAIETGRKTLADVFKEQQEIIREVADAYRKQQEAQGAHDQGLQDSPYYCDFDVGEPCPQGLQGSDCINYKLWMYNCHQFGFGDCHERLNDVRSGRVSLSDIFEEQDELIKRVVMEHNQKRSFSTDSRSQEVGTNETKSESNPSTLPVDTVENLSQGEKLKRAVKEYGGTVIVFHVTISLISLGGAYLAVTR